MLDKIVAEVSAIEYSDGRYYMGRCPFHDDHRPSLRIDTRGYKCYACGARGSLRKLQAKLSHTSPDLLSSQSSPRKGIRNPLPPFQDLYALQEMLSRANRWLIESSIAQSYIKQRGLEAAIKKYDLGYHDGWYTIPIRDEDGSIIGGVVRAGLSLRKYVNDPYMLPEGQPNTPYIPDWRLWRTAKMVAVVFGIFDAITLALMGIGVCTPTAGKGSVNPEWFDDTRKRIYIIPDKKEEIEAYNLASKLGWRGTVLRLPYPDNIKDCNDYLQVGQSEILKQELQHGGLLWA